jgi:signal transduction histidine kinase
VTGPVQAGTIGELFHVTSDAVVIVEAGEVVARNRPATALFGEGPDGEAALAAALPALLAIEPGAEPARVDLRPHTVVDATRRSVGAREVLLLRDVTAAVRRTEGLRTLGAVARDLLAHEPSVAAVLQRLVTGAKEMTGAAYSALLLLRPGSLTETSHFVYDAPRHLFPTRMPRVVGLLSVPLALRGTARLDDIRGHPAGVGLPGVHPPMGPLVATPLIAGDELLGEVAIANPPDGRAFDEVDEALLEDLAAHAATAVLWAQQAEAERAARVLRQEVVDTARHDIRTPLGAGKGYAQLLSTKRDRMTPEQVATALEGVVSSFDRIESFTRRLLVDERQEVTGVVPEWQDVEVAPLLASLRQDTEALAGRDAVRLHEEPGAPARLAGDPEMVREVLDNLVGNALKHAPGSPVTVTVRAEGDQVRFDVRDEGPGIPQSEQAVLFDRWTRSSASTTGRTPGFGLGLSIVRRLVTAHGGLLGVSSRPGEGATFWVTFPATVPA